jgi:hypothetical protein
MLKIAQQQFRLGLKGKIPVDFLRKETNTRSEANFRKLPDPKASQRKAAETIEALSSLLVG